MMQYLQPSFDPTTGEITVQDARAQVVPLTQTASFAPQVQVSPIQVAQPDPALLSGYGPDQVKALAAAYQAEDATYAPLLRAQMQAGNRFPQLDVSGSANWAEGLGKGIGNFAQIRHYKQQELQDQQALADYRHSVDLAHQQRVDLAQKGVDLARAQKEARYTQLEGIQPGLGQADLASGGKLGDAYFQQYGTGAGKTAGDLAGLRSQMQALKDSYGVDLSSANTRQLTPQERNIVKLVTGQEPEDFLSAQDRLSKTTEGRANAYTAGVKAGAAPIQTRQEIAKSDLSIENSQLANTLARLKLQLAPENEAADLNLKYATVQEKTQALADRAAARQLVDDTLQHLSNGGTITPVELLKVQTTLRSLKNLDPDLLGSLKALANPRAGKPVDLSKVLGKGGGPIQLPSGQFYDPTTGRVHATPPVPRPAPAKQPTAKPATSYNVGAQGDGTVLTAAPQGLQIRDIRAEANRSRPGFQGLLPWLDQPHNFNGATLLDALTPIDFKPH